MKHCVDYAGFEQQSLQQHKRPPEFIQVYYVQIPGCVTVAKQRVVFTTCYSMTPLQKIEKGSSFLILFVASSRHLDI